MGFFSWITQDTDRSICNNSSARKPFPITMIDDKGNTWKENSYDGYGEFGGKDYYELLSEMNGGPSDRDHGIDLAFKDNPSGEGTENVKFPNLVENPDGWIYDPTGPATCPDQGFFYCNEEDDFDDFEEEDEDHTDTSNF